MSCRTSSYFSSIESAIAVPPAPWKAPLQLRDLSPEASLFVEERVERIPGGRADPLLDVLHPRFELLAAQLAHALLRRQPLGRHARHGQLRQQAPRVLVLHLRLHRGERHLRPAPG